MSCRSVSSNETAFIPIDKEQVTSFLLATNKLNPLFVPDAVPDLTDLEYAVPHEDWITKIFTPAFRSFISNNRLYYREEENDCEDFVAYGVTTGRLLYYHSPDRLDNRALSIGHLDVMHNLISHRLLMILAHDGKGNIRLVLYEAQNQSIVEINPNDVIIWGWQM